MLLRDLPPVEELNISVPEAEVVKIGSVSSWVEELVVIESLPGNPAIDLDSVLFIESGGRALGRVFDVIGPVSRPFYCVRFNSVAHIKQTGVERGMDVYFAPRTEHTTFVFLEQLMKMKIRFLKKNFLDLSLFFQKKLGLISVADSDPNIFGRTRIRSNHLVRIRPKNFYI